MENPFLPAIRKTLELCGAVVEAAGDEFLHALLPVDLAEKLKLPEEIFVRPTPTSDARES